MDWPTIDIDSWASFEANAAKLVLPFPSYQVYLLRGQPNSDWQLTPSLNRLLRDEVTPQEALVVEQLGLQEFQQQAHLHLSHSLLPWSYNRPGSDFLPEWLSLMQHHGCPTRLLDWTLSPYVALYFAVEKEFSSSGSIFLIQQQAVNNAFWTSFQGNKLTSDMLTNVDTQPAVLAWKPQRSTDRMSAQQGFFTLSTTILGDQDELIAAACKGAAEKKPARLYYQRWIINASIKRDCLRRLRLMNIAAHSLFPGIDGLGRSLAELARLSNPL